MGDSPSCVCALSMDESILGEGRALVLSEKLPLSSFAIMLQPPLAVSAGCCCFFASTRCRKDWLTVNLSAGLLWLPLLFNRPNDALGPPAREKPATLGLKGL